MKQICIYPKDAALITGKSMRWGRLLISKIKKANNKTKDQLITVNDFCNYTGIPESEVAKILK